MCKYLKLFIVLLFGVMAATSLHAEPDELQRYLASIAQERDSINVTNADAYFSGSRLAPIEGVWRISGSEGIFAIIADPATIFCWQSRPKRYSGNCDGGLYWNRSTESFWCANIYKRHHWEDVFTQAFHNLVIGRREIDYCTCNRQIEVQPLATFAIYVS